MISDLKKRVEKSGEQMDDLAQGQVSIGERMEKLETEQQDRVAETSQCVAEMEKKAHPYLLWPPAAPYSLANSVWVWLRRWFCARKASQSTLAA